MNRTDYQVAAFADAIRKEWDYWDEITPDADPEVFPLAQLARDVLYRVARNVSASLKAEYARFDESAFLGAAYRD